MFVIWHRSVKAVTPYCEVLKKFVITFQKGGLTVGINETAIGKMEI